MKLLHDFQGLSIRLIDERLGHILEHPEMNGMELRIENVLAHRERVFESLSDSQARLYNKFQTDTAVGEKYLCVVVKMKEAEAFVLTASLTDRIKRGVQLWPKES